jgi:anti-sigma28 factor (negative regulator of flagellin synthesis)
MSRPKHQTDADGRLVESVRNERLELLRKQVADGTYEVSSRNVAAAMLRQGWGVIVKSKSRG